MKNEKLKEKIWNEAIYRFGYAYIFEKRSIRLLNRLRTLEYSSIILPIIIGIILTTWGNSDNKYLFIMISFLSGIFSITYMIFAVWSIVNRWQESYSYAIESNISNKSLSEKFVDLAKKETLSQQDYTKFEFLNQEKEFRQSLDERQTISEDEKRLAMRSALRQFQKECVGCQKVPNSMEPTNCPICGDFNPSLYKSFF